MCFLRGHNLVLIKLPVDCCVTATPGVIRNGVRRQRLVNCFRIFKFSIRNRRKIGAAVSNSIVIMDKWNTKKLYGIFIPIWNWFLLLFLFFSELTWVIRLVGEYDHVWHIAAVCVIYYIYIYRCCLTSYQLDIGWFRWDANAAQQ